MELYRKEALALATTLSSSASPYDAWVDQTYYFGDRVYSDPSDGGDGNNYECKWGQISNGLRPENYTWAWINLGDGYTESSAIVSSADESLNPTWSSGTATGEGAFVFDPVTRKDYAAATDISSGENTIRPSVCVQSPDVDLAARWVEYGPANAYAALDDEISTRTSDVSELTMTLVTQGQCDRITLLGLVGATDVEVVVNAVNRIADPTFISQSLGGWGPWDCTLSHLAPGMRLTNTNTATICGASILLSDLVPGVEYVVTATADPGVGNDWWVYCTDYDGSNSTAGTTKTGSGDATLTFTATQPKHWLGLHCQPGVATLDVSAIVVKETSVSEETLSVDLEYGTTGRYQRVCYLSHTLISGVQYEITITGKPGQTVEVGLITAGAAIDIGSTESSVRAGWTQYHDIVEDEYANTRFRKRPVKRELSATVWLEDDQGDYVDDVMRFVSGGPVTFNFNNGGTTFERLIVHGWAEDWETIVTGLPGNDYMTCTIKGLGE